MKLHKSILSLGGILFFATFLLTFRISELMMFIGDFGWFYLAARDMVLTGVIPLVGIPSSHPWLHQGPLWTYLLGTGLWLSDFNPLAGAITGIVFGIGSILLIHALARSMYGERVGLITTLLYASSPLIIIHARMPYHTAPIPFFTILLFYALYRFISGSPYYLAVIFFSLGVLYNLELATVVYGALVSVLLLVGLWKKTRYMKQLAHRNVLVISFIAGLVPMIPILIYDSTHGFPQTVKFAAWIGYKLLTVVGYSPLHPEIAGSAYPEVIIFFLQHMQKMLFLPSFVMAVLILLVAIIWFSNRCYQEYKRRSIQTSDRLLMLWLIFGIGGFFVTNTTSEAYLPMLFPQIMLLLGLLFSYAHRSRWINYFAILFVSLMVFVNTIALLRSDYLMAIPYGGYGPTFAQRTDASHILINKAGEKSYTISGGGPSSEFSSYTMNYVYLTWYLNKPPVRNGELHFIITDTPVSIRLEQSL